MYFSPAIIISRLFSLILLLSVSFPLQAHKIKPSIITLTFDEQATVTASVETNLEAVIAGIGREHENTDDAPQVEVYRALRELPAAQLQARFREQADTFAEGLMLQAGDRSVSWKLVSVQADETGDTRLTRKSRVEYQAELPPGARQVVWSFAARYGDAVAHFVSAGQAEKKSYWLVNGEPSPPYPLNERVRPRLWHSVTLDYIGLGYTHILPGGLDHILFVLGLFLLSLKLSPLLWQVTAFTLAHTLTLALSIYGVVQLSALVVEPLIALSIVYVGVENVLTRELKPWRVVIVFLFGLLHGMGFAGVLNELGLPARQKLNALISFNFGVELGQLSVILIAFSLVFWWRQRPLSYRKNVVVPGSLLISCIGLYWTWQRVVG